MKIELVNFESKSFKCVPKLVSISWEEKAANFDFVDQGDTINIQTDTSSGGWQAVSREQIIDALNDKKSVTTGIELPDEVWQWLSKTMTEIKNYQALVFMPEEIEKMKNIQVEPKVEEKKIDAKTLEIKTEGSIDSKATENKTEGSINTTKKVVSPNT